MSIPTSCCKALKCVSCSKFRPKNPVHGWIVFVIAIVTVQTKLSAVLVKLKWWTHQSWGLLDAKNSARQFKKTLVLLLLQSFLCCWPSVLFLLESCVLEWMRSLLIVRLNTRVSQEAQRLDLRFRWLLLNKLLYLVSALLHREVWPKSNEQFLWQHSARSCGAAQTWKERWGLSYVAFRT